MLTKAIITWALVGFAFSQGMTRVHSHGGADHAASHSEPHFHVLSAAQSLHEHSHNHAPEPDRQSFELGGVSADEHDLTAVYFSSTSAYASIALKQCSVSDLPLDNVSSVGCPGLQAILAYSPSVRNGEGPSYSAREIFLAPYSLRI